MQDDALDAGVMLACIARDAAGPLRRACAALGPPAKAAERPPFANTRGAILIALQTPSGNAYVVCSAGRLFRNGHVVRELTDDAGDAPSVDVVTPAIFA